MLPRITWTGPEAQSSYLFGFLVGSPILDLVELYSFPDVGIQWQTLEATVH